MSNRADHRPHLLVMGGDLGTIAALSVMLDDAMDVHTATTTSEGFRRLGGREVAVVCQFGPLDAGALCFLHTVREVLPNSRFVIVTANANEMTLRELALLRVESLLTRPVSPVVIAEHIATLAALPGEGGVTRWLVNRYVAATLTYLSTSYAEPLTIDRIASAVGASASHLVHVFRDVTGSTIRECLTRLRVAATKNLLLTTDDKLETIAERVGFCDASHLSRVFRHATMEHPGEFRRSRRRAARAPGPALEPDAAGAA